MMVDFFVLFFLLTKCIAFVDCRHIYEILMQKLLTLPQQIKVLIQAASSTKVFVWVWGERRWTPTTSDSMF